MFPNSISQAKASNFKGSLEALETVEVNSTFRLNKRHQYKSYSSLISLRTHYFLLLYFSFQL